MLLSNLTHLRSEEEDRYSFNEWVRKIPTPIALKNGYFVHVHYLVLCCA